MKIGLITLPAFGHLNPTTAIARRLQARHHDVIVFSQPAVAPFVQAAGLPFAPCAAQAFSDERMVEVIRAMSRLRGRENLQFSFDVVAELLQVKWLEITELVSTHRVDALVVDDVDNYSAVIPLSLGLPFAVLSNALHFDYSGQTPLCVYDWPHAQTPAAQERNRQGVAEVAEMLVRSNAPLIAQAEQAGIKANWADPSSLYADRAWISQCPREFDFTSPALPGPGFHYAGPFHHPDERLPVDFPWKQLTGEPLIYASLGTIQTGDAELFRVIVQAAARLKGTQLVLSVGQVVSPKELGPLPDNAVVVSHAPQLELLRRAALCVTHAGFNTTLEALAQGVPLVALPQTHDQPGVAARIAYHQAGLVCPVDGRNARCLAALMQEALHNACYRAQAREFQAVIARTDGLSRAADLVEQSIGAAGKAS